MSMRLEAWLVRAEALICTGTPGLYRVLLFAAIQHAYSLAELGNTASDFALAQLAAYLTAIGWASLILVRVPTAVDSRQSVDTFYGIAWMAGISTIVVTVVACCASLLWPALNLEAFLLLTWSWSVYQLARHFFVACRQYRKAVFFDFLLIVISYIALRFCRLHLVTASVAVALALFTVSAVMFAFIGLPSRTPFGNRFDRKGLQFGATNFFSGGIILLLVPIASKTCGAAFAGGFSLLSSITAIAILLPRAVAMTQLSELAKLVASRLPIDAVVRSMVRVIWKLNLMVFILNVATVIGAVQWSVHGLDSGERTTLIVAGLLLSTQYAVAMGGTVQSSVMMVFERAKETVAVNVKTTAIFVGAYGALLTVKGPNALLGVLIAALIVGLARNSLIGRHAQKTLHAYPNTIVAKI